MARCNTLSTLLAIAAALIVADAASTAYAQSGSRGGSSYSSFEINRLRRNAIGTGYTGQQLNSQSLAQAYAQAPRTGVGTTDRTAGVRNLVRAPSLGLSSQRSTSRPFSDLSRRPTVSPYLNLFDSSTGDGFSNDVGTEYQTLVRPMLEQQRRNQQVQSQVQQINARLQTIAAQPAFSPTGSQQILPTGTPSTFRFYSHYYPNAR